MKIVIPGGSGQVGHILARGLMAKGHDVTILSRSRQAAALVERPWRTLYWDGRKVSDWTRALEGADVCINLAGRSVNCRYHARNRAEIYNSRVQTTKLLNEVIGSLNSPPRVWMNASTATIYRHALDRNMDEASGELGGNEAGAPETWNFSIDVAKSWEAAFFETPTPNTRKVAIRSAMTFSPERGGVFDVLLRLVRFGFGGRQGSGTQYVSWIHEDDFVRALLLIIKRDDISGVVNVASPNPLPNREFMRALRRAAKVPVGLPVPEWAVEIGAFFLRTESELILKSRRVVPGRLLEEGFRFKFPEWEGAARDLVGRWRRGHHNDD